MIEEIARIYGYDRIEITGKLSSNYLARTSQPEKHKLQFRIAELLAANCYHEIYTNALTKSSYARLTNALDEQQQVSIVNPLSGALDALRQTLLFTGLEVVAHNINRKISSSVILIENSLTSSSSNLEKSITKKDNSI